MGMGMGTARNTHGLPMQIPSDSTVSSDMGLVDAVTPLSSQCVWHILRVLFWAGKHFDLQPSGHEVQRT